jgi:Dolichyl-phosphate-mannose-protein mannosyltransferase
MTLYFQRERLILFFVLILKALIMTALIFSLWIGLGPDEAQYWNWSQLLDWGYYSKPPGIAWQIWLGTQLFGSTEWGVRSLAVCIAFGQAWLIFELALQAKLTSRQALWSGLLMAFSPLGILGSLFAITDGGFLLCWTGACLAIVSKLSKQQTPNFLWVGFWIMLGALFKWPIYLLWGFLLSFLIYQKIYFRWTQLLGGVGLSLIGLLPSVWWNYTHDWVTFRHVAATVQGGSGHIGGNLWSFIGSQILLVSPLLFGLLIFALIKGWKQRTQLNKGLLFCSYVTILGLFLMVSLSTRQKIQGNWSVFVYPTAWIIVVWAVSQARRWLQAGIACSIILMGIVLSSPKTAILPYAKSSFKHNLGWHALPKVLDALGYDPTKHFLVSDKYQTTSELGFYSLGQQRAYFLNLHGIRNNQFSYWPNLQEEQKGKAGYFIWIENSPHWQKERESRLNFYAQTLPSYFKKVEFLGFIPLIQEGSQITKAMMIFYCQDCLENQPKNSALY